MQTGSGTSGTNGVMLYFSRVTVAPGGQFAVPLAKDGSYHVAVTTTRGVAGVASAYTVSFRATVSAIAAPRFAPDVLVPAAPVNTLTRTVIEHVVFPQIGVLIQVGALEPAAVDLEVIVTATPW